MGNRITERATDNGGTLVKNIQRTVDALNRVQTQSRGLRAARVYVDSQKPVRWRV